jgi:hypothetical protein
VNSKGLRIFTGVLDVPYVNNPDDNTRLTASRPLVGPRNTNHALVRVGRFAPSMLADAMLHLRSTKNPKALSALRFGVFQD